MYSESEERKEEEPDMRRKWIMEGRRGGYVVNEKNARKKCRICGESGKGEEEEGDMLLKEEEIGSNTAAKSFQQISSNNSWRVTYNSYILYMFS